MRSGVLQHQRGDWSSMQASHRRRTGELIRTSINSYDAVSSRAALRRVAMMDVGAPPPSRRDDHEDLVYHVVMLDPEGNEFCISGPFFSALARSPGRH
jgi:hypothetical protein